MNSVRCFKVNPVDNVATMLDDVACGDVEVLGDPGGDIEVREPVKLGHKIALLDIGSSQPIVKFGVIIGRATRDIRAGDWVHLHNCASSFDERSQTLDPQTGAATDTKYE
jgi:altronate dehydratase small subunit